MNMILEINNLGKTFGDKKILYNISFSVGKNDIFGLLGPQMVR